MGLQIPVPFWSKKKPLEQMIGEEMGRASGGVDVTVASFSGRVVVVSDVLLLGSERVVFAGDVLLSEGIKEELL